MNRQVEPPKLITRRPPVPTAAIVVAATIFLLSLAGLLILDRITKQERTEQKAP